MPACTREERTGKMRALHACMRAAGVLTARDGVTFWRNYSRMETKRRAQKDAVINDFLGLWNFWAAPSILGRREYLHFEGIGKSSDCNGTIKIFDVFVIECSIKLSIMFHKCMVSQHLCQEQQRRQHRSGGWQDH
jgi:hypothetical protein